MIKFLWLTASCIINLADIRRQPQLKVFNLSLEMVGSILEREVNLFRKLLEGKS